jgi:hypothetical protein
MKYFQVKSFAFHKIAQHRVQLTVGTRRVFKQFLSLKAGSGKVALSRPTHQYPEGA